MENQIDILKELNSQLESFLTVKEDLEKQIKSLENLIIEIEKEKGLRK